MSSLLLVLLVPCLLPLLHPVLGPHWGLHGMARVADSIRYASDDSRSQWLTSAVISFAFSYSAGLLGVLASACGVRQLSVLCCQLILLGLVAPPGRRRKHRGPAQIARAHLNPPLTSCARMSHRPKQITWPSPSAHSRGWYCPVTGKPTWMYVSKKRGKGKNSKPQSRLPQAFPWNGLDLEWPNCSKDREQVAPGWRKEVYASCWKDLPLS